MGKIKWITVAQAVLWAMFIGTLIHHRSTDNELHRWIDLLNKENQRLGNMIDEFQKRPREILVRNKKYYSCEEIKEL